MKFNRMQNLTHHAEKAAFLPKCAVLSKMQRSILDVLGPQLLKDSPLVTILGAAAWGEHTVSNSLLNIPRTDPGAIRPHLSALLGALSWLAGSRLPNTKPC